MMSVKDFSLDTWHGTEKNQDRPIGKTINGPAVTACLTSNLPMHPHAVLYLDEISAQKIH